eukprot:g30413.t1
METIRQLAGKLVLNAVSFAVPEARHGHLPLLSAGVYVLLSTMNHSCMPSARFETCADSGAELSLKTNRRLEVGEQLTLAYVSPDWPLEERQPQLSHWFFECRCPKCEAEGTLVEMEMVQTPARSADWMLLHKNKANHICNMYIM